MSNYDLVLKLPFLKYYITTSVRKYRIPWTSSLELSKLGVIINMLIVDVFFKFILQERNFIYAVIIVFIGSFRKRGKIVRCMAVKK